MLDDRYTTETSIWIVLIPMLVSVYIASLLIIAVFANIIDDIAFKHITSNGREFYISCTIFFGFLFSSFCISIATYIAVPTYKKFIMVVVFFVPIIWPKLITLFLFGIKNTKYSYDFSGIDTELVMFVSGSIIGGFLAYNLALKFDYTT